MTNLNRNRLINAVVFFAANVRHCGKIKLFKLLYLLDFEHFRQTGKSVTGVEYQAWKFGPVPIELMEEWDEMSEDLCRVVHIEPEKVIDYMRETVKVNEGVTFDAEDFTPRQLRIMNGLADRFRAEFSPKMIDVTHEQNGAWDKVWRQGQGAHQVIPYKLAVGDDVAEREELLTVAHERAMYLAALKAARSAALPG
ncbi:MAG TPA: Panacea domain-containing protein [Aromatoleum sp.]|uniref:Panacea domain-containing protein n=1 Tax=Aromatoleum sp. TaxID=2307007 RepID=UPI002B4910E6|nr:Panacea domain-containing protein [Aromatoleum sp.]HJV25333.1 Panacea domain-containing protein [Aromatoleum sp.]